MTRLTTRSVITAVSAPSAMPRVAPLVLASLVGLGLLVVGLAGPASATCNNIALGTVVSGTISSPSEEDCFFVDASVGDRIRVSVTKTSGTLAQMHTITRPDTTLLCFGGSTTLDCLID